MLHLLNNKKLLLLPFVVFFLLGNCVLAQSNSKRQRHFDKALGFFTSENFPASEKEALKALETDSTFMNAWLLLADIYKNLNAVQREIEALEKAVGISTHPLVRFRLAEVYFADGKYSQALGFYEKYIAATDVSENRKSEVLRKIENCRFALHAIQNPIEYNPRRLSDNINSPENEYWPHISLDQEKLVFTRLVKSGAVSQEDFYVSELVSGNWGMALPISELNTSQNEGAQSLSADGKLLFFTACNRPDGFGSCDIYYSRFFEGKWTQAKNAGTSVNTSSWEAHPGFSSDNRYLYFSSDRWGGKGAKDIWRAEFNGFDNFGNPKWGAVENLGDSINTQGNEISPFIHPNNINFYFVSDFLTGMGGDDLFSSVQKPDGTFSKAKNMGYPINTNKNELGLNISADGRTAYFSSEREANKGLDIFSFELAPEIRPAPVTFVKTSVINAKTKQPVQGQVVLANLTDLGHSDRAELTDSNGELLLCLPQGANYAFSVSKDGFLFFSKSFQLTETRLAYEPSIITIPLEPVEIGAEMNLYNIYFETDSFALLPESEPELMQLVTFLKNNPALVVEIQGHTDNSGDELKNQELSEKRAQSVAEYLMEKGIPASRFTSKGYGETHPVAANDTPENRMLNRRTTIRISAK
jgi:outer membrane protein OmpA-like peptidoglycan-associated protein